MAETLETAVPGLNAAAVAAYQSPYGPYGSVSATSGQDDNPVARYSAEQQGLEAMRELPRALMGGTDAMRAASAKYAPRHPAESTDSYAIRISQTVLYNAFAMTVVRQAGKLFMKPVTLDSETGPIVDFCNNVDGQGNSITAFAFDLVCEAMVDGVCYIIVDYPEMPVGATQADVTALGARPYWVKLCAGAVLGWKAGNQNGQYTLEQLRFFESVEDDEADTREEDDEGNTDTSAVNEMYEDTMITQIRVLQRGGAWAVYRKMKTADGKEDWLVYKTGKASWTEIPVIPVFTRRSGFFGGKPPLRELAELSAEHWCSSSEQRRALSFLRFAMLAIVGAAPAAGAAAIEIGPDKVLTLPEGASASYIEHTGSGIDAGRNDLLDIEKRMQSAGMELSLVNAGQVTATAAAIDSHEANAGLKAVAQGGEDALDRALQLTADLLRAPTAHASVYDEFAEDSQGAVADFVALYNAGAISRQTVLEELVRRHVLDEDFNIADEADKIQNEMPTLQGQPLALGAPAPGNVITDPTLTGAE